MSDSGDMLRRYREAHPESVVWSPETGWHDEPAPVVDLDSRRPRVRIFTTGGQMPEIVRAVETRFGIRFVDTLGKRWRPDQIISYKPIEPA